MNEAQRDILNTLKVLGEIRISKALKDANALVSAGLAEWAGKGKHFDILRRVK